MGLDTSQRMQVIVDSVENVIHLFSDKQLDALAFIVWSEQSDRYQRDAIADAHTLEEGE